MDDVLISVIIPVYNAVNKLSDCIRSILGQVDDGFEVVLIDDGSDDGSSEMCDYFEREYDNIRVFHQVNKGCSNARNVGINHAKGDWIVFVDSDDFVNSNFMKAIKENISTDLDLIFFCHKQVESGYMSNVTFESRIFQSNDRNFFIRSLFLNKSVIEKAGYSMRAVWAKAYNRKFLIENEIRFDEDVTIGEDMLFLLRVYSNLGKMKCVDEVIYNYYFQNENSLTNKYKPNYGELVQAYDKSISDWLIQNPQYRCFYELYRLNDIVLWLKFDILNECNNESYLKKIKRMKSIFCKQYLEYYTNVKDNGLLNNYSLSKRICFWLAVHKHMISLVVIFTIRYKISVYFKKLWIPLR